MKPEYILFYLLIIPQIKLGEKKLGEILLPTSPNVKIFGEKKTELNP